MKRPSSTAQRHKAAQLIKKRRTTTKLQKPIVKLSKSQQNTALKTMIDNMTNTQIVLLLHSIPGIVEKMPKNLLRSIFKLTFFFNAPSDIVAQWIGNKELCDLRSDRIQCLSKIAPEDYASLLTKLSHTDRKRVLFACQESEQAWKDSKGCWVVTLGSFLRTPAFLKANMKTLKSMYPELWKKATIKLKGKLFQAKEYRASVVKECDRYVRVMITYGISASLVYYIGYRSRIDVPQKCGYHSGHIHIKIGEILVTVSRSQGKIVVAPGKLDGYMDIPFLRELFEQPHLHLRLDVGGKMWTLVHSHELEKALGWNTRGEGVAFRFCPLNMKFIVAVAEGLEACWPRVPTHVVRLVLDYLKQDDNEKLAKAVVRKSKKQVSLEQGHVYVKQAMDRVRASVRSQMLVSSFWKKVIDPPQEK